MQSIQTKYLSATNKLSARIKATCTSGISAIVHVDYALSHETLHFEAVKKLCKKLGWRGEFVAGATKSGFSFVFENSATFTAN